MSAARSIPRSTLLRRIDVLDKVKLAFMAAGFVALVLSVSLWFSGEKDQGLFVGLWVPAIHSLGALVLAGERHR